MTLTPAQIAEMQEAVSKATAEIERLRSIIAGDESDKDSALAALISLAQNSTATLHPSHLYNVLKRIERFKRERDAALATIEGLRAENALLKPWRDFFERLMEMLQATEPHTKKRHPEIEALLDKVTEAKRLRTALERIKGFVCGDAHPNWTGDDRTTAIRGHIADLCDAALSREGRQDEGGKTSR